MPPRQPSREPPRPTTRASVNIERVIWARLAPIGPQQCVLTLALGGADAEHVVDDEAADEHRDQGEDRQEEGHERQVLLDRALALLGDLLTGEHLDIVIGDCRLDRVGQFVAASSSPSPTTTMPSSLVVSPITNSCAVARSNMREGDPAGAVGAGEADDADDGEVARGSRSVVIDTVSPSSMPAAWAEALSSDHFVGFAGGPSVGDLPWRALAVDPRRTERRGVRRWPTTSSSNAIAGEARTRRRGPRPHRARAAHQVDQLEVDVDRGSRCRSRPRSRCVERTYASVSS